MSGLVLVTTPIGNYKDISEHAIAELKTHKYIYSEDTRVTKELFKNLGIDYSDKYINSFHDHTGEVRLQSLKPILEENWIVLVSDAGSPIISDPAFPLVRFVLDNGFELKSVSGISAVTNALELSGLPPSPFHFHAFVPREAGKRNQAIEDMMAQYGTHIFFEGVSRVEKTMDDLAKQYPDIDFCIARELTKSFESVYRFKGSEWKKVKFDMVYKGEFVILFYNPNKARGASSLVLELAHEIIDRGIHPKKLSKLLSELTDISAKEIYQKLSSSK